jgi:ABC-type sugar transport system permease subunit
MANVVSGQGALKKESFFTKKGFREGVSGYIFIAPFLIGVFLFQLYVFISGFYLSLTNAQGINAAQFIGFDNYKQLWNELITGGEFYKAFFYTIEYEIGCLITQVPVAFVLSFILNSMPFKKTQTILRTAFFIPCIINTVIVAWLFGQIFNPDQGTIDYFLGLLGLLKMNPDTKLLIPIDWTQNGDLAVPLIIIVSFWQWTGYHMVYFLSQLQTIDPHLYEAAKIDGATSTQILTRITLPLMRPAVAFVMVSSVVGGLLVFDMIYIIFQGATTGTFGPGNHAKTFMPYIYDYAFNHGRLGLASAAGWMVFAIIAVINIIQIRVLGLGSSREEE